MKYAYTKIIIRYATVMKYATVVFVHSKYNCLYRNDAKFLLWDSKIVITNVIFKSGINCNDDFFLIY